MNLKLSTLFVLFVILYWNEHLGELLQPAYRHHHGNHSLFLYVSVYMCHVAWALIYPSAGLSASVFGDFRGCLATWIYGSGGWGRYQKPCGSGRRDPGEMERERERERERKSVWSLQLIRSTSSSQAEFIPAADLQYVRSLLQLVFCISPIDHLTTSFASDVLSVFCAQFSDLLLIYSYLKSELSDSVLGGVWRCAQQWETGYSDRRVGGERDSANSPRLSALLTYELHVAKRVYVY